MEELPAPETRKRLAGPEGRQCPRSVEKGRFRNWQGAENGAEAAAAGVTPARRAEQKRAAGDCPRAEAPEREADYPTAVGVQGKFRPTSHGVARSRLAGLPRAQQGCSQALRGKAAAPFPPGPGTGCARALPLPLFKISSLVFNL